MASECELSPLCHDQSSRLPSAALVPLCLLVIHMMARQPSRAEGEKKRRRWGWMRRSHLCDARLARLPGQRGKSKWK